MNILVVAAEGELQNAHPGKVELCAQAFDLWRDYAEIFRDDWQITKCRSQSREQLATGSDDPFTVFGGRLSGGNLPTRHESAKMIDAHQIELRQRKTHALNPPPEAVRPQPLPIVKRIAPKLS